MEVGVMAGLREHRLVLVAMRVRVVGVRKEVIVPSLSSSRRRLQPPIVDLRRASTLYEVQGGKPRLVWVEGLV